MLNYKKYERIPTKYTPSSISFVYPKKKKLRKTEKNTEIYKTIFIFKRWKDTGGAI